MPKLTTDFNVSPYYDDFDEANKFFRVLYRPGFSVQARELTQMQTILQDQLEKLGDHVFVDGSRVSGAELTVNTDANSLKLKTNYAGLEIDVSNFTGRIIEGNTSGAKAEVLAVEAFTQTTLNTLMINYLNEKTFVDDEIIQTTDSGTTVFANVAGSDEGLTGVTTLVTSISSQEGSVASIDEGVFYVGGYFVFTSAQTIILEKYSSTPTFRLGLSITESISTSVDDANLLDNAIGSPNYTAPGANRYKIDLTLVKKDFFTEGIDIVSSGVTFSAASNTVTITTATDHNLSNGDSVIVSGATQTEYNGKFAIANTTSGTTFTYFISGAPTTPATGSPVYTQVVTDPIERTSDENFIELIRIESGQITKEVAYPVYGAINDLLARRTFDQAGDFTVTPFSLDFVNHKIAGTASSRTAANACTNFTGSGTGFVSQLNAGDVIFLSGNTTKTATIDSISNNTVLTLTSGTALGDGSDNQKIGVDTKVSAAMGPGKAYVKGYDFETVTTQFLDVEKGRDTRTISSESQGMEFGPFLKVTDLISKVAFDVGANTANGSANGAGMDLLDLHMVKWPSTSNTHSASSPIVFTSNGAIDFVGIRDGHAAIGNTKIGTARVRQFDYRASRDSTVTTKYGSSGSNTHQRRYHSIYDAHLFDFRFRKVTGTVGAAVAGNSSVIKLENTSGADSFPTQNSLFGVSITVNTSFMGVNTSDTRQIINWMGANNATTNDAGLDLNGDGSKQAANYHALLDSPLTQPTTATSTYSIDFGVKDIRSAVQLSSNDIVKAFNIDPSGKHDGTETSNTILFGNNDDERTLIFPLQNKAVANLSPTGDSATMYKFKRTFTGSLSSGAQSITAPSGEKFFPATTKTLTDTEIDNHYVVQITSGTHDGTIIEFSNTTGTGIAGDRSIALTNGGESITIDTTNGGTGALTYSGETFELIATMQRANAEVGTSGSQIGKKTLVSGNTTQAVVDFNTANATQATSGQIMYGTSMNAEPGANNTLRLADVKKLVAIIDSLAPTQNVTNNMVTSAIASTANQHNITSRFEFDTGQKDNYYDYGKISLKPGQDAPTGQVMAIVDYYTHAGQGPFTVDSYIYSGSGNTGYGDIPSFTSPKTGNKVELRDVIDFRPRRIGIETSNADSIAYVNDITATSNVFAAKVLPDFDFTFDTDYAHYLPRKDKITLTRDRKFKVIKGVSDVKPQLPPDDDDSLTLYSAEIPAYTFNPSDIKTRYIDNRKYTMRDIGKLERRIENLEYYVSLSLLEKEADGLTITDSNGNDRFKNGILVDPFAGHGIGDVFNEDYNVSIDFDSKELRPPISTDLVRLNFDSNTQNSTLVNNGGLITLPFSSRQFITQPLSGSLLGKNVQKTYKINPFSTSSYIGQLALDPPTDNWYDRSSKVTLKVNLEGQYDNWPNITTNDAHGSHYNDWEDIWSGKQLNNDVSDGIRDTGDSFTNDRRAKTTGQTKTLSGLKSGNVPEKIVNVIGNKVVNVSVVPKVRQQSIHFVSKGLKPNKNVFAYFGDTRVSTNIKQATVVALSNVSTSNVFRTTSGNYETIEIQGTGENAGNTAKVLYMTDRSTTNGCSIMITDESLISAFSIGAVVKGIDTGANGTISSVTEYNESDAQLVVNNEGVTAGKFNIPGSTFDSGEILFRLTDDIDNIPATTTSVAEVNFHAKGVLSTRDDGIISTRPLIKRRDDITQEGIVKSATEPRRNSSQKFMAPMAQSFYVSEDTHPSGLFLDNIELFFRTKDGSATGGTPVTLQLRPMINGYPSPSIIIPGSEVVLNRGRVTANTTTPSANTLGGFPGATLGNSFSANKSGADVGSRTIFKFDMPVYLVPGEYAITILSNTSEYSVYGFELGAKSTGTDRKITKQPYVGRFFKPSNAGLQEGLENEGLMFILNSCNFTQESGYGRFDNQLSSAGNATANLNMDTAKIVSEILEFSNTANEYRYFSTSSNGTSKGSATVFPLNKNFDFETRQQITYTANTKDSQYQNSFQTNVYFTTANSFISPVLDEHRLGIIAVNNDVNNGGLSNSNFIITNFGAGLLRSQIGGDTGTYANTDAGAGNTSVFTVSAPDVGSNTATIAANVHANGSLNTVRVVNPGAGYTTTPTVTTGSITNSTNPQIRAVGEGSNSSNMVSASVDHSRGGNITARYITRKVTLEEGFDARDIRVYLNAYKPRGTNIYCYYKVMSGDDPESFEDKPYVIMSQDTSEGLFSLNKDDFKQYVYRTADEVISYTDSAGAKYDKFRTFAVKIVFTLDRDVQTTFIGIPKITDLRVVALDSEGKV